MYKQGRIYGENIAVRKFEKDFGVTVTGPGGGVSLKPCQTLTLALAPAVFSCQGPSQVTTQQPHFEAARMLADHTYSKIFYPHCNALE